MTILTKNFAELKARVEAHVAAWDGPRDCFIHCLSDKSNDAKGIRHNQITYGLPVMVQRIAENIYKALPARKQKAFFAAFLDAVECDGKDLSRVGWKFLGAELRECAKPVTGVSLEAVNRVIAGIDLLSEGRDWPVADADYAARAAANAAYPISNATPSVAAASNAARSAAYAADVAYAAIYAVYAIQYAAHVTCSAKFPRVRLRQRNTLFRLIKEAPVIENV